MTLWIALLAAVGMVALAMAGRRQHRDRPSAQQAAAGSSGDGYIPIMDSGDPGDCSADGGFADGGGCGDGGGGD